jgi:ribonuclease T2
MKPAALLASLVSAVTLIPALALLLAMPAAQAREDGSPRGRRPGDFDYYLLTLSWSPTYCLTHGEDSTQCAGKGYGFVLHGLWPQYEGGGYPERCSAERRLGRGAEAAGMNVFISPTLMRHEWQTHGTCSGLDATTYFRVADRAFAGVRIPPAFEAPRRQRDLTATQVGALFRAANPALGADSLTVHCSRGELSEVRICLTRELQPRACGRGVRNGCPGGAVEIPARR